MNQQPDIMQQPQQQFHKLDPSVISTMESLSYQQLQDRQNVLDLMPYKLRKFMDMDNIATDMDEEELQEIASISLEGYDIDKESRRDWEEIMKKAFELVDEKVTTRNSPWPGSANVKYPLIHSACIQFNARTNPEIIKQDKVVKHCGEPIEVCEQFLSSIRGGRRAKKPGSKNKKNNRSTNQYCIECAEELYLI